MTSLVNILAGGGDSSTSTSGPSIDLPDNPNASLPFAIRVPDGDPTTNFDPQYYPSRFNETSDKDLKRDGQQCKGEDVSVKTQKNADIHITGMCLTPEIPTLRHAYRFEGPINILSPIMPEGGMEAIIKSGEIGNLQGWSKHYNEWQWEYTIDLVSTGQDEFGGTNRSDVVSGILDEGNNPREDNVNYDFDFGISDGDLNP